MESSSHDRTAPEPGVGGGPRAPAAAHELVRPRVVVSECLGFAAVRYNGQILTSRFVEALRDHVNFVRVCPEVGMGMGVPRDPIRVVLSDGEARLHQPSTGRDWTGEMRAFCREFLGGLGEIDGFILKSKSPSCGISDVKIFAGEEGSPVERDAGLFARAVLDAYPWAATQDEGRLTNLRLRHHFLAHLWTLARLRRVEAGGEPADLVRFQAEHKLLLLSRSPDGQRELGRLVAEAGARPFPGLLRAYRERLGEVFSRPPRAGPTANALQHAFGYVSGELEPAERKCFLDLLERFRGGRAPLPTLLAVLRAWILRFDVAYLADQRLFEPYPHELVDLSSSGDGQMVDAARSRRTPKRRSS